LIKSHLDLLTRERRRPGFLCEAIFVEIQIAIEPAIGADPAQKRKRLPLSEVAGGVEEVSRLVTP